MGCTSSTPAAAPKTLLPTATENNVAKLSDYAKLVASSDPDALKEALSGLDDGTRQRLEELIRSVQAISSAEEPNKTSGEHDASLDAVNTIDLAVEDNGKQLGGGTRSMEPSAAEETQLETKDEQELTPKHEQELAPKDEQELAPKDEQERAPKDEHGDQRLFPENNADETTTKDTENSPPKSTWFLCPC